MMKMQLNHVYTIHLSIYLSLFRVENLLRNKSAEGNFAICENIPSFADGKLSNDAQHEKMYIVHFVLIYYRVIIIYLHFALLKYRNSMCSFSGGHDPSSTFP